MEENKNNEAIDTSSEKTTEEAQKEEVIYESNAQRRLRLLGVENDSKIHDQSQEITKGNFWANLWYKRKWTIIISAFFIIMAIILACTIIFQEKTDLSVGYIGPSRENAGTIKEVFEPYVKDVDKDGKKELSLSVTEHYTNSDSAFSKQANEQAKSSFYQDIINGNFTVVFIDKSLYFGVKDDENEFDQGFKDKFYTIDNLIDMGANIDKTKHQNLYKDGATIYESAIIVAYTKLGSQNGINNANILMCFPKTNVFDKDASTQIEFLNNILAYENAGN